jgi:hypothetical protein
MKNATIRKNIAQKIASASLILNVLTVSLLTLRACGPALH